MEDDDILGIVYDNESEWTDEEIGKFVRIALTEDKTVEDIYVEIGKGRNGRERSD